MVIRDFYFAAWMIKNKGYFYQIENGKLTILNIDKSTLSQLYKDYTQHHKPYYDCIKQLIREANQSRGQN